jgi:hypothetical protein
MIVIAKALVIGDLILRGLKGMIGRDAHNWMLGIRIVFLQPVTSTAL